ncbi:COX6A, subunit VIa of cytochrome c oxidase [Hygrophoropsis aurantiaca]|uniref:COX6A, subunit VIa of cytochrome c oxidase n=1 Tax=Hygrophoropsis aurantiaca TaxID=72124 RepID=A0ACB8ABM6_9AGAM|nr:COX6A, subunit VIa of cytochrome c oxidase [Hygrophoropsis aurantiaca]
MSFLARSAFRAATRVGPRGSRTLTVDAQPAGDYFAKRDAVRAHAAETTNLWRRISFFVCFPATAVVIAWVIKTEEEHAAHIEHAKEENGGHLPEIPGYDYMNRRVKPFPWGMNTLFYNEHVNKDMSQQE